MSDLVFRGCFPIEVLYQGDKNPVIVERLEDLQDRLFSVLRTRVSNGYLGLDKKDKAM